MTPLQQRRLAQVQSDIAYYEKQVQKKGTWFALRISWIITIIGFFVEFAWEYFQEDQTLVTFVNTYKWFTIVTRWAFWFMIFYFLDVKGNRKTLERRRVELETIRKKYGLVEEPVS
ncbi:MAG TPA: hypothetical protein VFZ78_01240 [Flavisolibacter sp.]